MCPIILFSTPSCSDNGRNCTSSNMLFASIVIVDQLIRGEEHCPAPLTPPCRHCLEPLCTSSHCLPSRRAVITTAPSKSLQYSVIRPLHLCLPLPVIDWGLMHWTQAWFLVIAVPRTQQAEGGGREINIRVQHPDKHSRAHTINISAPKCKYIRRDSFPRAQSGAGSDRRARWWGECSHRDLPSSPGHLALCRP